LNVCAAGIDDHRRTDRFLIDQRSAGDGHGPPAPATLTVTVAG